EDAIRNRNVTGVQTCALPIYRDRRLKLQILETSNFNRRSRRQSEKLSPCNLYTTGLLRLSGSGNIFYLRFINILSFGAFVPSPVSEVAKSFFRHNTLQL